jgi:hypothetical protein
MFGDAMGERGPPKGGIMDNVERSFAAATAIGFVLLVTGITGVILMAAEPAMCDKCDELDQRIGYYRHLRRVQEQQTTEGLRKLIKKMQAQKAQFHLDQKE